MGKVKNAALANAPLDVKKAAAAKPSGHVSTGQPSKFTYALAAHSAERRRDGWYIARTVPSFTGEQAKWIGPFETIETACLSIARHIATELADRHTRAIEANKIGAADPLYGLKPTTRLSKSAAGTVA
jgi:hypothetical protein